ncbi:MAG: aldehyde dehydrogenase family protein, partial [Rhodospirillaceae bacterium]|nr:aldehyde dehydrogenase family protein [Rhodospirillaceae bacterium]
MNKVSVPPSTVATSNIGQFINGRSVQSGRATFENRHPATNAVIGVVHEADADLVDQAVAAARAALKGPWGKTTPQERATILRKVAAGITARFDEFLAAEIMDTGKPVSTASHVDIPRGAANFNFFADQILTVANETFNTPTPDGRVALNYALRKPRGVIAVVCPWNLPLLLMTWKVAPALACGNTVVVKPSEETPATATLLGEVMNEAGVPPGVYNVVHGLGPHSAGEYLVSHPDVDGITFTGETRTGAAIMKSAAQFVRPVSFELGGKNAALVFADANMDAAIEGTMRSVFANCGQVCLGTERVYVQRPIYNEFVARLKQGAAVLVSGDPFAKGTTLGPVISAEHKQKVLSFYAKARSEGAEIIHGGGVQDMPSPYTDGHWIEPTIWTGLPETSAIMRDEIFGPCCHITPFDDEDAAIAMA